MMGATAPQHLTPVALGHLTWQTQQSLCTSPVLAQPLDWKVGREAEFL